MCETSVKCVLLAERHHGLIEGIRGLLETVFDAVVMVADPTSLLEGAERLQPAITVVELSLARNDGLELVRTLRLRCPATSVIVLSMHAEPTLVRAVLEAGAHGYVLKSSIVTDLLPAVEALLAGGKYISPAVPMDSLD